MDEVTNVGSKVVHSDLTKQIVIGVVGIAAAFFARGAATKVWEATFEKTDDITES